MTERRHIIGSYNWSEKTDGILSPVEKFRLLNMLVKAQVMELASKLKYTLGQYAPALDSDSVKKVLIPDSELAIAATEIGNQLYSPVLLNHCYRTYVFGALFSIIHNRKIDREVLYIGSMLHDVGLTELHRTKSEKVGFQVVGARYAYNFATQHALSHEQAARIYETISFHLNPYVSIPSKEPEAAFLQRGAMADVIGANKHMLGKEVVRKVCFDYPRKGFKDEILDSMKNISHARCSHAHILGKCGFEKLAENNSMADD